MVSTKLSVDNEKITLPFPIANDQLGLNAADTSQVEDHDAVEENRLQHLTETEMRESGRDTMQGCTQPNSGIPPIFQVQSTEAPTPHQVLHTLIFNIRHFGISGNPLTSNCPAQPGYSTVDTFWFLLALFVVLALIIMGPGPDCGEPIHQ